MRKEMGIDDDVDVEEEDEEEGEDDYSPWKPAGPSLLDDVLNEPPPPPSKI